MTVSNIKNKKNPINPSSSSKAKNKMPFSIGYEIIIPANDDASSVLKKILSVGTPKPMPKIGSAIMLFHIAKKSGPLEATAISVKLSDPDPFTRYEINSSKYIFMNKKVMRIKKIVLIRKVKLLNNSFE